jgi:hypothetical protein
MAYETLALHLLITVNELKEHKLDPYYFALHVSIDNAHSGHAKMTLEAACDFIEAHPVNERPKVWRRMQAGFILAEHLPTTPDLKRKRLDEDIIAMLREKAEVSQLLHANSKVKIGKQNLVQFLHPSNLDTPARGTAFLKQLSMASPWVKAGRPQDSKLIKEMSWHGPMFGAFTIHEKVCILSLVLIRLTVAPANSRRVDSTARPPHSASRFSSISRFYKDNSRRKTYSCRLLDSGSNARSSLQAASATKTQRFFSDLCPVQRCFIFIK